MTKPIRLTQSERESHAWQKVRLVIEQKLAAFRTKVENPEVPEAERLGLCWRIKELKALLAIEEPPKDTDAGE